MKKIRNTYKAPDGRPARCETVAMQAVSKIREASEQGKGVALTACEVRALDYSNLHPEAAAMGSDNWLTEPAGDES